mgnify:FL=1
MKIFKLTRKGRLTMAQKAGKYAAAVGCSGGELARRRIPREALTGDCRQALAEHPEGILECRWGCLGLGSCAAVCKLVAIKVGARGVAEVDRDKCVGCGLCVKACPQGIIRLVPREQNIFVGCSSRDSGPETRKACDAGCIACGICVKNCPMGAIRLEDNHPVIDESLCVSCGMCAAKCPRGVIKDVYGILGPQA